MRDSKRSFHRLGEQGVALPLALLGLVVVTILVTAALMTSSTEVALSAAHEAGTRGLYDAETALEHTVARRAAAQAITDASYPDTVGGTPYSVAAAVLLKRPIIKVDSFLVRRTSYSLVSAPGSGRGRRVGAMVDAVQQILPFGLHITSGAMVGTDNVKLPGKSYVITGQDSSSCSTGDVSGMVVAADVDTSKIGMADEVIGGIEQSSVDKLGFASFVLGGRSPDQAAMAASIKWGNLPGARTLTTNNLYSDPTLPRDSWMNWGCPAGIILSCATDPDTAYYPVVAIRANPGSEIHLTGSGQGVLIVIGDARLNSGFRYKGVVVVTGNLTVNGGTSVLGSLVALSDLTLQDSTYSTSGTTETAISGSGEIRFDRCSVQRAQDAANGLLLDSAPSAFPEPTYGWFEVVR
ncbi:MAG TPA: pilus assembly PilX N-terminal domain-containing protein [Longimicrobiaceae bacterium]|nr:pilus assembly PilX N-terminal domain-containing protein [Longimicrobiaceae bacterium]